MASLYLHIPFCKQACYYCDFHFSTNLRLKSRLIAAICQEIELQKDFLSGVPLESIYFGGGTPSLLNAQELDALFTQIHNTFSIHPQAEITLECNPDDIHTELLDRFKSFGINRLSLGVQSFHSEQLNYLNRAHDGDCAFRSVQMIQEAGFDNFSMDLIYGIPADSHTLWEDNLEKTLLLNPPHVSAYCLTIEEKTVFGNWLRKKKIKAVDDEFAIHQFEMLVNFLEHKGFEHYEISNFARDAKYSRHNTNYWVQQSYLGVGPGAHSYNQQYRQYNIAHNMHYIKALEAQHIPATREQLRAVDKANEYIMTRIRTIWGLHLETLQKEYNTDLIAEKKLILERYMQLGLLQIEDEHIKLSRSGRLLADEISRELFVNEKTL